MIPLFQLLEGMLTKIQYKKILLLFFYYPQLLEGKEVHALTSDISKQTGIRSDHVIRDYTRIGQICSRLKIEPLFENDSGREITDHNLCLLAEQKMRQGGRNNARKIKLMWQKY